MEGNVKNDDQDPKGNMDEGGISKWQPTKSGL